MFSSSFLLLSTVSSSSGLLSSSSNLFGTMTGGFFDNILAFMKSANAKFLSELSPERIQVMTNMPKFAFLLDIRILLTLVGIIAIIPSFFVFKSKLYTELKTNIRILIMSSIVAKYFISIFILLINYKFFFTISNLLFGFTSIYLIIFFVDIILFALTYWKHRRENYAIIGDVDTVINEGFETAKHFIDGFALKGMLLFNAGWWIASKLIFPSINWFLGFLPFYTQILNVFYSAITTNPITIAIAPTFNLLFVDKHYPSISFIQDFVGEQMGKIFGSHWLAKGVNSILLFVIGAIITSLTATAITYFIKYFCKGMSKIITFKKMSIDTVKKNERNQEFKEFVPGYDAEEVSYY